MGLTSKAEVQQVCSCITPCNMLVTVARSALMYIDRLIRLRDVGLGQLGKYLIDEIVEELVSGGFPKLDGVGWA